MDHASRLESIRKATAEAVQKYTAQRAARAAEGARPPQPGDVYLFPGPSPVDLHWVALGAHPDKDLLFAVPADGHPFVGLTDVEVPPSERCGLLVLRCGHGLWIHREEFRPDLRVGVIEERYVRRALDKLGQMAAGKLRGLASQWEAEANPDYEDWMDQVGQAVDTLADALRFREELLTPADFRDVLELRSHARAVEAESQYALAAASSGALAQLHEELQRSPVGTPLVRRVNYLYPGELFLVLEADGLAVVYLKQGDQPPPELHAPSPTGTPRPAEWITSPQGTAMRASFPWDEGQVRLRFGRGERAREVTVRQ